MQPTDRTNAGTCRYRSAMDTATYIVARLNGKLESGLETLDHILENRSNLKQIFQTFAASLMTQRSYSRIRLLAIRSTSNERFLCHFLSSLQHSYLSSLHCPVVRFHVLFPALSLALACRPSCWIQRRRDKSLARFSKLIEAASTLDLELVSHSVFTRIDRAALVATIRAIFPFYFLGRLVDKV